MKLRRFWIEFHKIAGLILVVPLLLQSFSGSVIVFDHAIDEWLNPDMLLSDPAAGMTAAPLSEIMRSASHALPYTAYIQSLRKPRHRHAVYTAYLEMQAESPFHGKRMEVLIDPYTAEVTGTREWGSYFTSFIYRLHFSLLMGRTGELLLGFAAMLVLVNVIAGIYLGWPRNNAGWRWLFNLRKKLPAKATWRRRHIQCGLLTAPVLMLLVISGISMIFHHQTDLLLDRPAPPDLDVALKQNQKIDIDNWLAAADRFWPDAQWMRISQPTQHQPAVNITLRKADDPRHTSGSYQLWLHPQTLQVLAEQDYSKMSTWQKTAFWLFPLHSGEAFGLPGRLLIFISGLLTTILIMAGGILWYRRQRSTVEKFI